MWEVGRESPYDVQAGLSSWSLLPSLAFKYNNNTVLCPGDSLIKSNWKQEDRRLVKQK